MIFNCNDCHFNTYFSPEYHDVLSSSGACRNCGSHNWVEFESDKKLKCLSIDDEFTSFDMIGGDLITFGVVEVFEDYTLGRTFYGECKPRSTKYFTQDAEDVHGISYFKASQFPEAKEMMLHFLYWLKFRINCFPLITAYYGSWNFDLKWIEKTMDDVGYLPSFKKAFNQRKEDHINVLKLARENLKHIPMPEDAENEKDAKKRRYGLNNVAKFYNIKFNHHNSLDDAKVTALILGKLMNKENTWSGRLL